MLVSPKGLTKYSMWPIGVLNAIFHLSPFMDTDQMVGILKVQLSEEPCIAERFEGGIDDGGEETFFFFLL